jgi:hypothetical protein
MFSDGQVEKVGSAKNCYVCKKAGKKQNKSEYHEIEPNPFNDRAMYEGVFKL